MALAIEMMAVTVRYRQYFNLSLNYGSANCDVAVAYHMSVIPVQRSKGHSAVATAAYLAGVELTDERTGHVYNYTCKKNIEHAGIIMPSQAGNWQPTRGELWNLVEIAERRKDGIQALAHTIVLPVALTSGQRRYLVERYAQDLARRHGCAVDFAIPFPTNAAGTHAYVLATTREVGPEKLGANCERARRERRQEYYQISTTWEGDGNMSGTSQELRVPSEAGGVSIERRHPETQRNNEPHVQRSTLELAKNPNMAAEALLEKAESDPDSGCQLAEKLSLLNDQVLYSQAWACDEDVIRPPHALSESWPQEWMCQIQIKRLTAERETIKLQLANLYRARPQIPNPARMPSEIELRQQALAALNQAYRAQSLATTEKIEQWQRQLKHELAVLGKLSVLERLTGKAKQRDALRKRERQYSRSLQAINDQLDAYWIPVARRKAAAVFIMQYNTYNAALLQRKKYELTLRALQQREQQINQLLKQLLSPSTGRPFPAN